MPPGPAAFPSSRLAVLGCGHRQAALSDERPSIGGGSKQELGNQASRSLGARATTCAGPASGAWRSSIAARESAIVFQLVSPSNRPAISRRRSRP